MGCGSRATINMDVVTIQGDLFHGLRADTWELGEIKGCKKVTYSLPLPGKVQMNGKNEISSDLLLCGTATTIAWEMLDVRDADYQRQRREITELAKQFSVALENPDVSLWDCRRTPDGLICK